MKNFISTIAMAIVMLTSLSSFANRPLTKDEFSSTRAAATYYAAITKGNIDLKEIRLTKDFEYQNLANSEKYNRSQYIKFLKQTKGIQYDCKTSFTVLDESGNSSIAKITMEFEDFTRVDYITLCKQNDTWCVSKVVTTYP